MTPTIFGNRRHIITFTDLASRFSLGLGYGRIDNSPDRVLESASFSSVQGGGRACFAWGVPLKKQRTAV